MRSAGPTWIHDGPSGLVWLNGDCYPDLTVGAIFIMAHADEFGTLTIENRRIAGLTLLLTAVSMALPRRCAASLRLAGANHFLIFRVSDRILAVGDRQIVKGSVFGKSKTCRASEVRDRSQ